MAEGGRPDLELQMHSQPLFLAAVRALVGTVAQRVGFNEMQCSQISLAVDEALCNVITHGYGRRPDGRIWIRIWPLNSPGGLRIVVEDECEQVDPSVIRSRDLDDIRPGGLGVHIIREIMDEVVYERRDKEGMRLTMVKRLQAVDEDASPTGGQQQQQRVES